MTPATALMLFAALAPSFPADEPEIISRRLPPKPAPPAPLARAEGTPFTLARVTVADGMLTWTMPVVTTKVVPAVVTVHENGVTTNQTVNRTVTTTESHVTAVKLAAFDIATANGKSVPTDDVAKRLKAGGILVLVYRPLDETTRKWFADDAMFFMPVRERHESRPLAHNQEWAKLTHEAGTPMSLVGAKAKDGVLSWTERANTGTVVTVQENGAPVTRTVGAELKYESKEMKLTDVKITGMTGEAVAAVEIEKRLKDGGVLVRTAATLSQEDRKLFRDGLFLEPPAADPRGPNVEIYSGPDRRK